MESNIICDYEYDKKISFALQQNHVQIIKYVSIKNNGFEKLTDVRIHITSNPRFSEPETLTLEELNAGEAVELRPDLILSTDYLSRLDESIKGYLEIKATAGERILFNKYLPVDVLSFDSWPGSSVLPEIISSFITPNRPFVMEVITKASEILQQHTKSSSMDGYQSGDPNRVIAQLSAIFSALQSYNITYANPPASFESEGQKIRFPDSIKKHRLATCLDLTLLYAACAEAIGIHAIVVFFKGHACPGFWLKEYAAAESFQDDKSLLTKSIASGINEMILVESTYVTNQQAAFSSAVLLAENSLTKPDYFEFFIDVQRSRIGQIKPVSIKAESGAAIQAAPEIAEPVQAEGHFDVENVEMISEDEPTEQLEQSKDKVMYWKNKLIDMSLRNNLLNYRLYTQGVPVVSSSIDSIEDTLSMGKKVFILPLPNELRNKTRDFRGQKELLNSRILTEDMKNNRLRSTLTNASLEKELVKLYRKAKNTLEETGANALFIALGFLKWFEPNSYSKERFAPILLLPVDLVRMSAKSGYYIRARDEEVQINISLIEYLRHKFGMDASKLYDIPKDDHGVDVRKVLTSMRRLIMQMEKWDVQEVASIGLFSFSKFVMWNDLVKHSDQLKENKVVASLIEGNYINEENSSMTAEVDEEIKVYAPLSSDSTQSEAIWAAGGDNSFVLHGPPGSGKSQTITNMISHALATGKTVLFVAEKMAALNVVQKRLAEIGLADFCLEIYSNKGQKKDILKQLENSFEAQHKTRDTDWSEKFAEIQALKKELNQYVHDLHRPTALGQSIYEMIETYSNLKKPATVMEYDREKLIAMDEITLKRTKQFIENIAIAGEDCGDVVENPWIGIKQTHYSLKLHDLIQEELTAFQAEIPKLRGLENTLAQIGITDCKKNFHWYQFLFKFIPFLQTAPEVNLDLLSEDKFELIISDIRDAVELARQHHQDSEKLEERFDPSILKIDTDQLLKEFRLAENSWFMKSLLGKRKIAKELKQYVNKKEKINFNELETIITTVKEIQEKEQVIKRYSQQMADYFPGFELGSPSGREETEASLNWLTLVRAIILDYDQSPSFIHALTKKLLKNKQEMGTTDLEEQMTNYMTEYEAMMTRMQTVEKELVFNDLFERDQENWLDFAKDKASRLIGGLPQLKDNCKLAHAIQEAEAYGLNDVTQLYKAKKLRNHELLPNFLYSLYRTRIDEEIAKSECLAQFSKAGFENNINRFKQLDDELSELTKLEVYVKLMRHVPNLMDHMIQSSEPGILLKAIKSKGRGIAIRQLFRKIQNLLPKIKPCMLMSPLSVAQYLNPSSPKFDLVIFDEASQLPTSEAVGAMGRGKNVIIVGDPKQLPPTSFFNVQQAETDFDLQDMESVLDDCLSIRMPQKHLRWHYRSEHESLISFSNHHFYENKLITFPSVDDLHSRVTFRNVHGVYDRGKSKQNKLEAEAVVNEIFSRLSQSETQHESIGVVTFSQVQQTLIEDIIDERLKQDAALEKFFTDEVPEPVFIKNLENVQGDERDIILFSVGYGPDETGHLTLNFGPLNRDGGWRRLNVAISRAKKEMVVFASMEPDKINLLKTNAEGVHSLKAFIEFAKKGNVHLSFENRNKNQTMNSKVIIPKIRRALEKEGYQVKTDVGNSEFKIDLAVVDNNKSGHYLAGILIDGYRYAQRRTVRDRDKLSELVLGRLGWHIIKVWSIEWWYDEEKQIESILSQIHEIEKKPLEERNETNRPEENNRKKESIQDKINSLIIQEEEGEKETVFEPVILEAVSLPNKSFYTSKGLPIIREQIRQIIDCESPISFSRLSKIIIHSWGFSRSGAQLEAVIQDSLNSMMLFETIEEKGKFLWKDEKQFETYSIFRQKGEERRELEDISKVELANGNYNIMKTALRLPKSDLMRELSKQLGFSRVTGKTETYLQEAICFMKEKGLITETEDEYIELLK